MLSINGKKFMNLPEAVQWLLDNNALSFQCKANYVADTVIAKSDIINPSPAEIKVGSLVLFADSKVGTVSGLTDSGFMVGQDYTDIGLRLNQITDIAIDASQHLIFTLANGDTIDAGLIKELSGLSIDASQHLIATYNDGSTTDLGAIFQGNINISGNLVVSGSINGISNPSLKPIYWHSVRFSRGGTAEEPTLSRIYGTVIILNDNDTPIDETAFRSLLATQGFYGVIIDGKYSDAGGTDFASMNFIACGIRYKTGASIFVDRRDITTNELTTTSIGNNGWVVTDLGANKIN